MEYLSLLRLLVGLIFLGYASYSDLKTRRVKNAVWMILGAVGFLILALDLLNRAEAVWAHYLIFLPAGLLFYEVYIDRELIIDEDGLHFVPGAILIYGTVVIVLIFQGFLLYQDPDQRLLFFRLLTIPAMITVAHIFFQSGLLKGGADAKALMAIAVLVPFYPEFYGFPLVEAITQSTQVMSLLFPFSLVILMNSAILVVFVPLAYLMINARKANLSFPQCLVGYRVSLDEFPKHAWLMERVEQGSVRLVLFPRRGGDTEMEIKALQELGREEAWATPQLPFMVPMFFGLLVSFFIGNLILALIFAIA